MYAPRCSQFLVIWRFFRAVALADGIVPPENMGRCVCNNYDIEVCGIR
jgi:D-alanyl-lipoteichoic acid acyltransferase DltB (MBOAT superfamily)